MSSFLEGGNTVLCSAAENGLVLDRLDPFVLVIKFSRAEVRNALCDATYTALAATLNDAKDDKDIEFIILTGDGEFFCGGMDLKNGFKSYDDLQDNPVYKFMCSMIECPKVLIALVNGPAIGIGTTLLLHVDLVFALRSAYFWIPFIRAGIVPEFASSKVLPEVIGQAAAAKMVLLGQKMTAEEAFQRGLVGELLDCEQNLAVTKVAQTLRESLEGIPHAGSALLESKRLMRLDRVDSVKRAILLEFEAVGRRIASGKTGDAVAALRYQMDHQSGHHSKHAKL
ncbi:hypothetical protein NDN08_002317 [Rhodosorus marinus]|uniref:Enoyl-CoA hydratase n=1 Tax=Rhodosorus marinus TaxID=101924 RepID=A0AAV8UXM9_9RHOD|nr:hypothetical protein NDN08_002317 [Rhodosorus marinus]